MRMGMGFAVAAIALTGCAPTFGLTSGDLAPVVRTKVIACPDGVPDVLTETRQPIACPDDLPEWTVVALYDAWIGCRTHRRTLESAIRACEGNLPRPEP